MERTGLDFAEAIALSYLNFSWWSAHSQQILRADELSAGEQAELDTIVQTTYLSADSPTTRLWYDSFKPALNPDAVRYVDNLSTQPR